ncbi:MAG TPA: helix-turn-helix domain-containing protein [Actinomycetaceae bacterium]|nr:helix-turn-helix domain-containing protein [Actinomycetaceae bacterium]
MVTRRGDRPSRSTAAIFQEALRLAPARRRVLELVAGAEQPLSVAEVAQHLDCHPSTVRPHLTELAKTGFLDVQERRLGIRGRPAILYTTRLPDPARIHFGLMSLVSTGLEYMSLEDAYRLGLDWGRDERQRDFPGTSGVDPEGAVEVLSRLGFDPAWESGGRVRVHTCPLEHRSPEQDTNLWELHKGLLRGLLGIWEGRFEFHSQGEHGGCLIDFIAGHAIDEPVLNEPALGEPELEPAGVGVTSN